MLELAMAPQAKTSGALQPPTIGPAVACAEPDDLAAAIAKAICTGPILIGINERGLPVLDISLAAEIAREILKKERR